MKWNENLSGKALEIAQSTSARLRVMAGPGTGKSFAMKRRIMRLIEEDGFDPSRILAVTFTRTAAADLKKELTSLGVQGADKIRSMTLHSFCFGLLNEKEVFDRLQRRPRPLKTFTAKGSPQFEMSPLLADLDLKGKFGNKREKFKRVKAFEAAWARKQNESLWLTTTEDREFKSALELWLRENNSMLIGELVPLALQYLEDNPVSDYFERFDHIVVDEYQDLNKAEQVLLDLLGKKCKLSIVGDIDQSIYSFRYAHPEGIEDFKSRHSEVQDYSLDNCQRCAKKIVSVANSLILNNHANGSKSRLNFLTEKPDGNLVTVQWGSSDDEINGITAYVQHLVQSKQYEPGDILILSPRRLLGYRLRDLLTSIGVAAHSFFHEEALEADEAQKSLTILNLLVNREDRVSLRFWLGFGSQDWRANQFDILNKRSIELKKTLWETLDLCEKNEIELKNISNLKNAFSELKKMLSLLQSKGPKEIVEVLFAEGKSETSVLREAAKLFLGGNDDATLDDLWDHLHTLVTQPEMPEAGGFVRIMSLHKSKGLTSKVTIVSSCVQGLMPNLDNDLDLTERQRMLEEQRRLFYVALTRPKEALVISSFAQVSLKLAYKLGLEFNDRGTYAEAMASQFLSELGPDKPRPISGIEWKNKGFE